MLLQNFKILFQNFKILNYKLSLTWSGLTYLVFGRDGLDVTFPEHTQRSKDKRIIGTDRSRDSFNNNGKFNPVNNPVKNPKYNIVNNPINNAKVKARYQANNYAKILANPWLR